MTPDQFTDWLSDLLEFYPDLKTLNETQTQLIKDKINTVFNKVTPELNAPMPTHEWQIPIPEAHFGYNTGCPIIDTMKPDCAAPPAGQSPDVQYCGLPQVIPLAPFKSGEFLGKFKIENRTC